MGLTCPVPLLKRSTEGQGSQHQQTLSAQLREEGGSELILKLIENKLFRLRTSLPKRASHCPPSHRSTPPPLLLTLPDDWPLVLIVIVIQDPKHRKLVRIFLITFFNSFHFLFFIFFLITLLLLLLNLREIIT